MCLGSTDGTTDCREHTQVSDELKPEVKIEPLSSHALFSLAATGNDFPVKNSGREGELLYHSIIFPLITSSLCNGYYISPKIDNLTLMF